VTEQQIDRDELLAWCRSRPSDDGLTTMYNHELRYVVDALEQAEARIKAVQDVLDRKLPPSARTLAAEVRRALDGG